MNIIPGAVWGLIPARGGSKSIPLKNLTPFVGRPLIDFQILAARSSGIFGRLLCSTDHQAITARCETLGVEVHPRPGHLGADDTPVMDVIADLLEDIHEREGAVAECIALLQPTSPFLLTEHIRWSVNALLADAGAGSAQTVVPCPHNHHAVNQRVIEDGVVDFRFAEQRAAAFNKQKKEKHYLFGNFLVFRAEAALAQKTPFANPSIPIEIPFAHGFDLDAPDDVKLGQALLAAGLVELTNS
ncbi:MAG: acylneuraminate cytidylyltransferase family protein [Rhodospirillaceae bacterium]|jgi:CMP-N,N'-diacetyllegionaminic acid synthase|nr:acylneuraminate cytidylyltransferase family protein [Rhodospirillaceae bacterium]MBT4489946.1 acylneuraminate cytidylyltransferase family protein [Rhodospirillaceae bacterium]MBT5194356.1 acylneuraminate cytidylyltransferase family protein [Rhodospirillaceae bacterium]MBT5897097.1 acylneuraminate cytidylyltransferase family protein [Rhodospirillaceae bacterium]MBT6427587.1 acylneuraminate cytidylyltransferase family protein [Rhodospirillaceae bacterium]